MNKNQAKRKDDREQQVQKVCSQHGNLKPRIAVMKIGGEFLRQYVMYAKKNF